MGARSINSDCRRIAAVFFASLLMALGPHSTADVFTYDGEILVATGAFSALTPVGSGLTGTITITTTPGGSSTNVDDLTEALLKMTAGPMSVTPPPGATLFCFNYEVPCATGETMVPVTSIDVLDLTFAANGCPVGTVTLRALSPTFGVEIPITLNFGPDTFFADGAALGTVSGIGGLDCVGGAPEISPSPNPATPINFGSVTAGGPAQTQNITITNTGDAALNVGTVALSGATDFTLTTNTCSGAAVGASGGTCAITVTFTPATVGPVSAMLSIPSDDADENPVVYNFSATVGAPPGTIATDEPLMIADTVTGMVMTGTVMVSNVGPGNLTIGMIETTNPLAAPFSVTADTCSTMMLAPAGTCSITVQFAPMMDGFFMDAFDIPSNDPTNLSETVNVSATALPPPAPILTASPVPLVLPTASVGTTTTADLTVSNTGDADLTVSGLSGLSAPFSVMTEDCVGIAVAPAGTCTITVAFAPTAVGTPSAVLMIASDDADSPAMVTVNGTATAELVPDIEVSAMSLTFGSVLFGDDEMQMVTVSNTGTADLAITSIGIDTMGEFSGMHDCPAVLAAAATCTITVTFAPMTAGPLTATLTIISDSPGEETVDVALTGTGVEPMPDIAVTPVTPPALDLGMLTVGVDPANTADVTVTNNGTAALNVTATTIAAGDFSVSAETCTAAAVAPMASCTVTVAFLPSVVGVITDTLSILSDDPDTAMVDVDLTGEGLMAPEPNITESTAGAGLDLGSALFTQSTMGSITVTNTGNDDLNISAVNITGADAAAFTAAGDCVGVVAQMATCTITVTFTAAAPAGAKTATVEVLSDDPDTTNLMIGLTAMSVMPLPNIAVMPLSLSFGVVDAGSTNMRTVTVNNTGDAALSILGLSLTGLGAANYSFVDGCGVSLPAAGSCTITITFAPTVGVDATYTGMFTITSDDPDTATINIPMTGVGVTTPTPNISSDVPSLDLGNVFLGMSSTGTVTLTNDGSAALTISAIAVIDLPPEAFFLDATDCPIMAPLAIGASCTVTVNFSPFDLVPTTGTLRIVSDDPDDSPLDISLSGTGLMPLPDINVDTTVMDFGTVIIGSGAVFRTVNITNSGLADLIITLDDPFIFPGSFAGTSDCTTVTPGGSCFITLSWNPFVVETEMFTFSFTTNDPDALLVTINVSAISVLAPEPNIEASTLALDFGSVPVGMTGMQDVTISNTGDADLEISTLDIGGTDAADFGVTGSCAGATLIPMATCVASVTYTATEPAGMKNATVTVNSNDPDTTALVINAMATAEALVPVAMFSATALIMPTVEEGDTSTGTITVTNTGTGDLIVTAIGTSAAIDAPFTLTSETCTAAPVASMGTCVMNFEFAPTAVGDFMEMFNFDSNDATPSRILSLEGSATMMPVPDIAVDVTMLDLGTVVFGDSATMTVTVTNNGAADLGVFGTTVAPMGDFSDVSTCTVVVPDASCTIAITYAPTAAGAAAATLTITSDDPDTATVEVALSGIGVMPEPEITVTPLALTLDSVLVGASSSAGVTVTNDGTADLVIGTVTIGGPNAGEFSRTSTCGTLGAGASCTVIVTYAPMVAGAATATLSITSNDADEGTVDVALSSMATAAPMPVISVPASTDAGMVEVGTSDTATIAVMNTGTSPLTVSSISATVGTVFAVTAETCTAAPVAAMSSCTVTVTFSPTAEGSATDVLVIASNDGTNPVVTLAVSGTGITVPMGSVSVTAVDFSNVTLGENSSRTITINNGGSGVLRVTSVTLSGTNAADFSAPNTCVTISAGSSCDLTVSFTPAAAGTKRATLTIATDDPALAAVIINLAAQASKIEEVIVAVTTKGKGSFGWLDLLALGLLLTLTRARRIVPLVCAAGLLAAPAVAQDLSKDGYWYAGAGLGSSTGQASEGAVRSGIETAGVTVDNITLDDSDSGWQGFVGYQATERFAIEFGYADLGEAGIDLRLGAINIDQLPVISRTLSENISFLGDGVRGSLVFKQPVGERASLNARVGLFAWEIDSGIGGTAGGETVSLTEVESGTDFTYGFGGEIWFGPGKFGVRAEWERFEFGDQDAEMWSIIGLFRFK